MKQKSLEKNIVRNILEIAIIRMIHLKKYLEFNDEQYKKEIYASPSGIGNGEIDNEANIYDAINLLKPGYVLYLREGTYVLNEGISIDLSGSIDDFITIRNYPNEKVCLTSNNKNI
ncbi:MAG: hypothetical protein L6U99_03745 [Clostridium sp.]|nr:MAG: hypothetical protein L6U99_03745 [Clostridium sp.]